MKRYELLVECKCGKKWDCKTNMRYYVNCPDCRAMVDIRDLTGVDKIDQLR